jgi:pilus assembly protein Flp/PilA
MNIIRNFILEEEGAAAAEYALILAIIGSAIAVAALLLGTNVGQAITDAATCVANPTAANC